MKAHADISIIPIGVGVSLSKYVAACERVFRDAGLDPHLHAFGTEIEGEWDTVMTAVRRCHDVVHEMGAPRITTTVKLSTRVDRQQSLADKVASVRNQL
ncbi:MAG TPA: MTH1187 family thiamine-binding protein [Vicinamibacterales bacterium]